MFAKDSCASADSDRQKWTLALRKTVDVSVCWAHEFVAVTDRIEGGGI
jgi:hypothetical protein